MALSLSIVARMVICNRRYRYLQRHRQLSQFDAMAEMGGLKNTTTDTVRAPGDNLDGAT